ncbi:MAG: hypothetical protein R2715_25200, partial [Ilumatobacteraceae bacterium]
DEVVRRQATSQILLVGIDGIDGAGKSTFADELALRLADREVHTVRASIDSFHRPRAERWARGRHSPAGFYLDSHDLEAMRSKLLEPFRAGEGREYRTGWFDVDGDRPAPTGSIVGRTAQVLVVDGIFIQRPELWEYWDVVVYLDGRHRVEQGRLARLLAERPDDPDGATEFTWAAARAIHRSSSAMDWYDALADPESNATFVIDNNDLAAPTIRSTPAGRVGPEPG